MLLHADSDAWLCEQYHHRVARPEAGGAAGGFGTMSGPVVRPLGTPRASDEHPLAGKALAAFALVVLIWGSTWAVVKDQISTMPPEWTVTWRFVMSAAGMFGLAVMRGERLRLSRAGARLAVTVGLSLFFVNIECVYSSEHYLPSGLVAVIYALMMVPNALLSRLFHKTRISRRFMLGSGVAMAGIALLILHQLRLGAGVAAGAAASQGSVLTGVGLALCGVLFASISNVAQAGRAGAGQSVVPMLAWALLVGLIADAAFALATRGAPQFGGGARYWLGVTYMALVGTVLAFPIYFNLIRLMGAGRAAYNGVAVPVVAMGLSTLFEGYRWSLLAAGGVALAVAGLVISLSGGGRSRGDQGSAASDARSAAKPSR